MWEWVMTLSVEELHAFDDLQAIQRQAAAGRSKATGQSPNKAEAAEIDGEKHLFGDDGFTFEDFLDIINPLQHIPVISTIYRELTGDKIAMMPRILGGTLFGGPIGAGAAVVNAALHHETGKDIGEHVAALFLEDTPSTLVAKSSETNLETAAGPGGTQAVTAEPLMAPNLKSPVVKATLAELEILKTEAQSKQSAQISWLTDRPAQKAALPVSAATSASVEAQGKQSEQISWLTDRPVQEAALLVVAVTVAEENILMLEKAMARVDLKRIGQKSVGQNRAGSRIARLNLERVSSPIERGAPNRPKGKSQQTSSSPSPWFSFQPASTKSAIKTSGISGTPPPGALAAQGGWFTDVMVSAMNKYEQGKKLKQPALPQAINQLN